MSTDPVAIPLTAHRGAEHPLHLIVLIALSLLITGAAQALTLTEASALAEVAPVPRAPGPPSVTLQGAPSSPSIGAFQAPEAKYSIGEPSDEEQLYVELINRARADVEAEANRLAASPDADILAAYNFFGVDLELFITQMKSLTSPLPPLSINEDLTTMARLHSLDQLNNAFQGHVSSDNPPAPYSAGDGIGERANAIGYPFSTISENVFSFAKSVEHGHAGFEVDWGDEGAVGGMQNPPGHRLSIHSTASREIGVGVQFGSNTRGETTVGPMLVTQNLGSRAGLTPYLTGVAFYDLNGNTFYDLGEGLGGVVVTLQSEAAWAESAKSGGFSVPVPGDGSYTVEFAAEGLDPQIQQVDITGGNNEKVDLILDYLAPVISGADQPVVGLANRYTYTSLPGATGYQLELYEVESGVLNEGAEPGQRDVTLVQSSEYEVIQGEVVATGQSAFHLAHASDGGDEIVTLNASLIPTASTLLEFDSRLGIAGDGQQFRVEISIDGGLSWSGIYEQLGTGNPGEVAFTQRALPLGDFEGEVITLRFRYRIQPGSFFPDTRAHLGVGLFLDNIRVTDLSVVNASSESALDGVGSFDFTPDEVGEYALKIVPQNFERAFPGSAFLMVNAVSDEIIADGDVAPLGARDGRVNVADALVALRYALGLLGEVPTDDLEHGDVAPLGASDGQLTVADALVILRAALGLITLSE